MLNLAAPKTARIKDVSMSFETRGGAELTSDEWKRVVIRAPRIRMSDIDTEEVIIDEAAAHRASTFR
jgi:hypothetical protein